MDVLKVENLCYVYSPDTPYVTTAVDDISFSVKKGEIFGIIGHTGSGKSTLLQMLNGLLKPSSGRVLLNGKDIWENPKNMRKIRSKIGLVFQYPEYQLFEETVLGDIAYGPKNMGQTINEAQESAVNAARTVNLSESLLTKSPFDLSGGEKRRVASAGIMAMQPEIIVFDEPTAGLDPVGRELVLSAIMKYREEHNATVVIVSHSMEDMALICDNILVLNDGKKVLLDSVDNVFNDAHLLESIGLAVPYVTSVLLSLKRKGINVDTNCYTVDAAVQSIMSALGKDGAVC